MPQGNGSPPVWRWPPAFPVLGESQLHATGSGAWWRRGDGAAVGTIQRLGGWRRRDGGVEDGEGGVGGGEGRGRTKGSAWDKKET